MRIISEFKDYYDSSLIYGIDPNIIFIRKQISYNFEYNKNDEKVYLPGELNKYVNTFIELFKHTPGHIRHMRGNRFYNYDTKDIRSCFIGFCGKLYPAFKLLDTVYYSPEMLINNITDKDLKNQLINITREELKSDIDKEYDYLFRWEENALTYKSWNNLLKECDKNYDDIFITMNSPIFMVDRFEYNKYKLTINPQLKPLNFQKIKNNVEAFQDIGMYLGNQLVKKNNPVINISDEIMRDEKGFDKWSFKKHKEDNK